MAQKAVFVKLPPRAYNVLRSFVDSSLKEVYDWNKPVYVYSSERREVCSEYGTGKRWTLLVCPSGRVLYADTFVLRIGDSTTAEFRDLKITCNNGQCSVERGEQKVEGVSTLNVFFVADVEWVKPLSLDAIIDKAYKHDLVGFEVVTIDVSGDP